MQTDIYARKIFSVSVKVCKFDSFAFNRQHAYKHCTYIRDQNREKEEDV